MQSGTGYPKTDPALAVFIGGAPSPLLERKKYCAAFIAGIFTAALSILENGKMTPLAFRKRLDKARIDFDKDAAEEANRLLKRISTTRPRQDQYSKLLAKHTKTAIRDFVEAAEIEDFVLFTIDECHTLHPKNPGERKSVTKQVQSTTDDQSTYHALCSVLRDLQYLPIFTLFISIASNARQLAPQSSRDPSARISIKDNLIQHPPYTAFPFDIYKGIIIENTKTLDEVCSLSFLCQFGRPLYVLTYLSRRVLMSTIS